MHRFAQDQIVKWTAAPRRKPLIVRGARRVGKTWLVEHVAARGFEAVVKVDLEKRRDLHVHFGDNLDPKVIVRHIELDSGRRIVPGKTLLPHDLPGIPSRHRQRGRSGLRGPASLRS